MAVALYVTGISTPELHPEFPPLLGTLTSRGLPGSLFTLLMKHRRSSTYLSR
jgi:hypothetical protein